MEGGLLCWELSKLRKTCQSRLWKWSLSLSPYRGSVRGAWWEGSCTEDSERPVMEGTGNSLSFIRLHKGKLKHLVREGSANTFIGPTCITQRCVAIFLTIFLPGLRLKPQVIMKTYSKTILAFIKAIVRNVREKWAQWACL